MASVLGFFARQLKLRSATAQLHMHLFRFHLHCGSLSLTTVHRDQS